MDELEKVIMNSLAERIIELNLRVEKLTMAEVFIAQLADSVPEETNEEHKQWQAWACQTLKDLRDK